MRTVVARACPADLCRAGALTEREHQIVSLAASGQHNKLIAYNLGISHSTVRVLMARAARRCSAQSRDHLIRLYVSHYDQRFEAVSSIGLAMGASCGQK